MELSSRIAIPEDAPAVSRLLNEANALKQSLGDNIWGAYEFTEQEVLESIARGFTHFATIETAPAATFVVLPEDPRMWGEQRGKDGQALYVHRLATANAFRGRGLSKLVLRHVEIMASEQDRFYIRLDAPTENGRLCKVYADLGFQENESGFFVSAQGRAVGVFGSAKAPYDERVAYPLMG